MSPKEKESYYRMTREFFKRSIKLFSKTEETYEKKYEPENSIRVELPKEIVDEIDEELKTRPGIDRKAWIMEAAIKYRNRDKE